MKKPLLILLFSLCSFYLKSQIINPLYIYESSNDSIDISNNFYDYSDSLLVIFNDSTYFNEWDTSKVYVKGINWDDYGDSIVLPLFITSAQKYTHPVIGKITSKFGKRRKRFHYGTDIDLNTGDTVRNAFDGYVRYTGFHKGYGNVVVVRNLNGIETLFAHLSKINVENGKFLQSGEIIGLGGNTGRSYGAHLHFEIRFKGIAINPQTVVDFDNYKVLSDTLILLKKNFTQVSKTNAFIGQESNKVEQNPNAPVYYTIRKGDNLGSIARKYGTTVKKLCQLNGIKENTIIREGKKLRVK